MSEKTYLITGITGMVGSHLCDLLLRDPEARIFGFCRWTSSLRNLSDAFAYVKSRQIDDHLSLIYGDLCDPVTIAKALEIAQPDFIFHLAAQSFPKASFDQFNTTYVTNVTGTHYLLDAATRIVPDARIHVCSSSEVFGKVSRDHIPIKENTPFHPASPYAISKVGTDLIAKYFAEAYNLNTVITRMFTHTGPRRTDFFAESSFAKQIALIEAGKQEPTIQVGNLASVRTVADVRDAVKAYVALIKADLAPGETFNIGGNTTKSVKEILEFLCSLSTNGAEYNIVLDKERLRPIDADLQLPDMTKFKNTINWEPGYDFETTMTDLLNYWRQMITKHPYEYINR